MVEILFHRFQLQEALEQYQLAGSLTASKDMALSCLINSGEILLHLGDYETAEPRLAAALQIDPNNNTSVALAPTGIQSKEQRKPLKRGPTPRPATDEPFPLPRQTCLHVFAGFLVHVIAITFPSDAECCPSLSPHLR
jgi:tetratricopeptide (TPR) repeat protein